MPLYTQQTVQEPLTHDDKTIIEEPSTEKENIMKDFDNSIERNFINDLIKGKKVYLYDRKKPNSNETEPIYSKIQLIDLNNLSNTTDEELNNLLKSQELLSLSNSLATVGGNRKNDTLLSYSNSLKKYKKKLKEEIEKRSKKEVENTPEYLQQTNTTAIKCQGIKKRNGHKIVNSKYNDKLLINMDKLYNNYYVEARLNDDILYKNQGDKDTVELLTKGRINKKKKYSKLSLQILNDMMVLSGMVRKRNEKTKLLGSSNIILNDDDRRKRINLLRGTISAGNDNKNILDELAHLTNQASDVGNKNVDDIYKDLKTLTPMLKASQGNENVYNRVYNIVDYLRSNRHITRDQYHKFIKKHLM